MRPPADASRASGGRQTIEPPVRISKPSHLRMRSRLVVEDSTQTFQSHHEDTKALSVRNVLHFCVFLCLGALVVKYSGFTVITAPFAREDTSEDALDNNLGHRVEALA